MTKTEPANARRLIDELALSLLSVTPDNDEAAEFVHKAAQAMRSAPLSRAPASDMSVGRYADWDALVALARQQHDNALIDAIVNLEPSITWLGGRHFWAAEKYSYFADRMHGAMVVGGAGAAYLVDEQYIVLLHIQEPHAIYPLHEHRIPEGYYIVAGNNEWTHDGVHWERHHPGELFYNASWQPHAIRTGEEPSLSLDIYLPPFGWEGGLCEERSRS